MCYVITREIILCDRYSAIGFFAVKLMIWEKKESERKNFVTASNVINIPVRMEKNWDFIMN